MTDTWWCEHAWLGGDSMAEGVLFTVTEGRITAVDTDTTTPPGTHRLRGLVIPGLPDLLGRVDLIIETDAELVITDWKTSRSRWS